MHSKINQVKINCLITCQYRQKQWHVDHAQLRMPADTLSSWYVPTYANTRPHAYTCRNISHPQCIKICSLWYMQTHADTRNVRTCPALDTW
jgi:hypothetical protein